MVVKPVRVAAVLAGVALLNAGCAVPAGSGNAGGNAHCAVKAHNPHESHGTPGRVAAKGEVTCRPKADSVTIQTRIQRLSRGKWVTVGTPGSNNDPAGKHATATASAACNQGNYRTAARGSGTYNGVPAGSRTWTYSKPVKNPCR